MFEKNVKTGGGGGSIFGRVLCFRSEMFGGEAFFFVPPSQRVLHRVRYKGWWGSGPLQSGRGEPPPKPPYTVIYIELVLYLKGEFINVKNVLTTEEFGRETFTTF